MNTDNVKNNTSGTLRDLPSGDVVSMVDERTPAGGFGLSLFKNKRDVNAVFKSLTWTEFLTMLNAPNVRANKDGPLFSPATFVPPSRANINVKSLSMLVLDIDHGIEADDIVTILDKLKVTYAIYTTHSHRRATESNPDAEPRFRVLMPLKDPIPAASYTNLWYWFKNHVDLPLDVSTKDLARMFYLPAIADADCEYYLKANAGPLLDWREVVAPVAEAYRPPPQFGSRR